MRSIVNDATVRIFLMASQAKLPESTARIIKLIKDSKCELKKPLHGFHPNTNYRLIKKWQRQLTQAIFLRRYAVHALAALAMIMRVKLLTL